MQSLTGLSRREIPDGDGMHCTGVRSSICHKAGNETYADVYFYSEEDFLQQIISPYFIQLKIGNPPQNLEDFAVREIEDAAVETAVDRAKIEHLKSINFV